MKLEKVNENQIRCTLTKADLADRQLKLSELAYGTEKAKNLFRDMMQQASYEFGFEAEDIPLTSFIQSHIVFVEKVSVDPALAFFVAQKPFVSAFPKPFVP